MNVRSILLRAPGCRAGQICARQLFALIFFGPFCPGCCVGKAILTHVCRSLLLVRFKEPVLGSFSPVLVDYVDAKTATTHIYGGTRGFTIKTR